MESLHSASQQNREIMQVEALLSYQSLKPGRGQLIAKTLNSPRSQPLNEQQGAPTPLSMVRQGFGSLNPSTSKRLTSLMSTLPKLSIPTPLQPLEAFTLFPELPVEIRLKVWKLNALQPRQVKLFLLPPTQTRHKSRRVNGQRKIPEIMHVCKESREEGLRYYTLCKEDVWPSDPLKPYRGPNHLYINFEIDHFAHDVPKRQLFGRISLDSYTFGPEVLKKIKFVDLLVHSLSGSPPFVTLYNMLRDSEALVEFRIILNKSEHRYARFLDTNDVDLEDFKLRECARRMLFMFFAASRVRFRFAKKLTEEAYASRDRGTLSVVFLDWYPPIVTEGAWDFSLEELDLQFREEERITF